MGFFLKKEENMHFVQSLFKTQGIQHILFMDKMCVEFESILEENNFSLIAWVWVIVM